MLSTQRGQAHVAPQSPFGVMPVDAREPSVLAPVTSRAGKIQAFVLVVFVASSTVERVLAIRYRLSGLTWEALLDRLARWDTERRSSAPTATARRRCSRIWCPTSRPAVLASARSPSMAGNGG